MADAYIIAAARGAIQPLSSKPRAEQVRPILEQLFQNGIQAKDAQEIHWHGREDEYWLNSLGEAHGFAADLARFYWASAPLLAHGILHLTARAIEAGERELVILAQEHGDQVVVLLVGSQGVVERYHAAPRLRILHKQSLSSRPNGMQNAIAAALSKTGQETGSVQRIAAARHSSPAGGANPFENAQWLTPGPELQAGDYFLLAALVDAFAGAQKGLGLLISEGPQKSGLVTVFEQV